METQSRPRSILEVLITGPVSLCVSIEIILVKSMLEALAVKHKNIDMYFDWYAIAYSYVSQNNS